MLRDGPLRPDAAFIMVSPPDAHGYVSLGVSADYTREAAIQAELVIAEVNPNMPRDRPLRPQETTLILSLPNTALRLCVERRSWNGQRR